MASAKSAVIAVLALSLLAPAAQGTQTISAWRETLHPPIAPYTFAGAAAFASHFVFIDYSAPPNAWVADVDLSSGDIVGWRQTLGPPAGACRGQDPVIVGDYLVLPCPAQSFVAHLAPDASILGWNPGPGWTDSMPNARGIAATGNRVYVAGSGASGSVETATVDENGVLSAWVSLLPSPLMTDDAMATIHDGQLYLFGGENRGGGLSSAKDVYRAPLRADGTIERWEFAGRMMEWRPHSGFLKRCGLIHVVGGGVHSFLTNTVESAPVSTFGITATHAYGAPLPTVLNAHASVVVGRWGYIMGGNSGQYGGQDQLATRVAELPCALPVADAGPDQTVDEWAVVTLQGSGSSPDNGPLSFSWSQVAGPEATLSDAASATPTFVAPAVPRGGAVLTFDLVVYGTDGSSEPSHINVSIKNVNHPPVAEVGLDLTAAEGSRVTLNGANSYDFDDEALIYSWTQVSGDAVDLEGANTPTPSFTAPFVGREGSTLAFQLVVDDGLATSPAATITVHVTNLNQTPGSDAGPSVSANEYSLVRLDGSATDPDGDAVTFSWTQLSGPAVVLDDPFSPAPSFQAPTVAPGGALLTFQLVVDDGMALSAPDTVIVQVVNVNDPPACSLAAASDDLVWPPNHKLLPIQIVGVIDPQSDPLQYAITSVTQDEPIQGTGDGDMAPDAVLQGSAVLVRAERSGNGDGRVYRISFTATDSIGESCSGFVTVSVPKSMGKSGQAVDSGQLYLSLGP